MSAVLSHPIEDVPGITGQPRSAVFRAVARGDLKSYRVGRRRHVTHAAVVQWIELLEKSSEAGKPIAYNGVPSPYAKPAKNAKA